MGWHFLTDIGLEDDFPNLKTSLALALIILQDAEKKVEEERIRTEIILKGNPLINQEKAADFKVKRR